MLTLHFIIVNMVSSSGERAMKVSQVHNSIPSAAGGAWGRLVMRGGVDLRVRRGELGVKKI